MTKTRARSALVLLVTAGLVAVLVGCSPLDLLNATIPRDGYAIASDMPYGGHPRQKLDVYTPDGAAGSPVVVFFYGGGWDSGDKDDYLFVGQALASQGFVTVIPDYRLYPEVRFPAFIKDGAAAVRWTRDHIGDFSGNPDRVFLMGHSAGAYIAAMLALDHRYLAEAGLDRSAIQAMVGLAGPYDFLPLESRKLKLIFTVGRDMSVTQPIRFADTTAPPALLVTGAEDETVLPRNTLRLAQKLRAHGTAVETRVYPELGHIGLLLSLAAPFLGKAPTLADVAAFIRAQAAEPQRSAADCRDTRTHPASVRMSRNPCSATGA